MRAPAWYMNSSDDEAVPLASFLAQAPAVEADVTGRDGDAAPIVGIISMRDLVRFALLGKSRVPASVMLNDGEEEGVLAPNGDEMELAKRIAEHHASLSASGSDSDSTWYAESREASSKHSSNSMWSLSGLFASWDPRRG